MTGTATINSTVALRHDMRHLSYKPSTRPHVLIVDDDPDLREFMAQVLMAEGFDTDLARNGRDALDKPRDNPPLARVRDLGAAATLRKPVDTDELISAIRALC
jgi:DNA-binding response OmpR family regulator